MTTVPDLRAIPTEPYIPLTYPPEGLIPAKLKYYEGLSVLAASRAGWTVKPPKV